MNSLRYILILIVVAVAVSVAVLAPYRGTSVRRSDGADVRVVAPNRLGHTADVWDYAQLGRQLMRGEGFTSLTTYVPLLPESIAEKGEPSHKRSFPLLWRPPGYPLLVGLSFAIAGGPHPDAILVLQGIAVVVLVLLTWLLGRSVMSAGWATLAAVWTLLSPLTLGLRDPLIATTLHAGLVAGVFALAVRARSTLSVVATGLVLGLAACLRAESLLLVPACILVLWRHGERPIKTTLILTGAFTVVVLPWLIRTAAITGDAFYNGASLFLHDTAHFPGWSASQTLEVRDTKVLSFIAAHPAEIVTKTLRNAALFFRDILLLPHIVLVPFFWFGGWSSPLSSNTRRLFFAAVAAAIILCGALAPLDYSQRFLACLVPLFCVVAAAGMSGAGRYRRLLAIVATIVVALTFVWSLRTRPVNGTARIAIKEIASLVPTDALVVTDAPELYAWIWERPALWSPLPEDLPQIQRLAGPLVAVVTCVEGNQGLVDGYLRFGELQAKAVADSGAFGKTGACPQVIRFTDSGLDDGTER